MRWLDPNKPVRKQMRSSLHSSSSSSVASSSASAAAHARFHQAPTLYFRVKFYVNGERERERVRGVKRCSLEKKMKIENELFF